MYNVHIYLTICVHNYSVFLIAKKCDWFSTVSTVFFKLQTCISEWLGSVQYKVNHSLVTSQEYCHTITIQC